MSYFFSDLSDNNNNGSGTEDDECDREVAEIFEQLDLQQEKVGELRKDIKNFQPIITTTPTQLTTTENKMPDRSEIRRRKQQFVDELKEHEITSVSAFPDVNTYKSEEEKQKELVQEIEKKFPEKSSPPPPPPESSNPCYKSDDESTGSEYLSDEDYVNEILNNADDWLVIISTQSEEAIEMKTRLTKYVIDTYLEVYQNNLETTHRDTIYKKIKNLFENIKKNNTNNVGVTQTIDGALTKLLEVNKSSNKSQQDLKGLIGKRKRPEEGGGRQKQKKNGGGRRFTRKVIKKRGGKKLVKSRKNVVRKTYKKMKNVKKVKKSKGKKRKTRKSKK